MYGKLEFVDMTGMKEVCEEFLPQLEEEKRGQSVKEKEPVKKKVPVKNKVKKVIKEETESELFKVGDMVDILDDEKEPVRKKIKIELKKREQSDEEREPVKKKRGRPKGSKNKKTLELQKIKKEDDQILIKKEDDQILGPFYGFIKVHDPGEELFA